LEDIKVTVSESISKGFEERFQVIESGIDECQQDLYYERQARKELEARMENMEKDLEGLLSGSQPRPSSSEANNGVGAAFPPAPLATSSDPFERPRNERLLKVNTEGKVPIPKSEVVALCEKACEALQWDKQIFEVIGDDVDAFFDINFTSIAAGSNQASAILKSFYDKSTKTWKEVFTKGVNGDNVRTYVGADMAPRKKRIKFASKKVCNDILQALGRDHKSYFRPYDESIVTDGILCAKVQYIKDDNGLDTKEIELLWIQKAVDDLGLQKPVLSAAFLARETKAWVS